MKQNDKKELFNISGLITIISILMGLFHLYTSFFGVFTALWQRSIHLSFGLVLTYLMAFNQSDNKINKAFYVIASLSTFLVVFYLIYDFHGIMQRFAVPNKYDLIIGGILIILVLDFTRRLTGNILFSIALLFLIYPLAGPYLPGILNHRGYDIARIVTQISLSTEGIFGIPLGVSANYIFLFVLFGAILKITGMSQFYIDFAIKLIGKSPGGPAKAAVVASCIFGSISGSAVANVVATGSVTIPLMKSIGYKNEFAAGVEAVASTGGQIMPPLMGAAAFIMAEILGIPYYHVVLGALIPALIYYSAIFSMVHFRAQLIGLKGIDTKKLPSVKKMLLSRGIYILPIVVLLFTLLVMRLDIMKAAVYTVLSTIVIGIVVSRTSLNDFIRSFEQGARTALIVIASTSCAGIIVAIINLTGLGMRFTNLILKLTGGNLPMMLVFMMFSSILLGMGLPTTPAYLILAVLGAPTLIRIGVVPLAAHMFVFYFGMLSMITPPVALAVYSACSIANSKFWETAGTACMLGITAFIVPYMFVYNPILLGIGNIYNVLLSAITGIIGAVTLGAGLVGWLIRKCSYLERVVLVASGFSLVLPHIPSNIIGLVGLAFVFFFQNQQHRKNNEVLRTYNKK